MKHLKFRVWGHGHLLGDLARMALEDGADAPLQRAAAPARAPHLLARAVPHLPRTPMQS